MVEQTIMSIEQKLQERIEKTQRQAVDWVSWSNDVVIMEALKLLLSRSETAEMRHYRDHPLAEDED